MLGKIEGRRRGEQQRMRWVDGIIDSMDMSLSKLKKIVKDRKAWHAAIHRVTKRHNLVSEHQELMVEFLGPKLSFLMIESSCVTTTLIIQSQTLVILLLFSEQHRSHLSKC